MTRTPLTTKTRKTATISRWPIVACAACILFPVSAQASHQVNRHALLPIVDKLHADIVTLEQLASRRWFPEHEFVYIQTMTKKACRLADAVKCDEHVGRIRGDYDVLRGFVRTVDLRLCRHRAAQYDHELMALWNSIKRDLDGAACLVTNRCSATCGHLVPAVVAPPYGFYGIPQRNFSKPTLPPINSPLPHELRAPVGRLHDVIPDTGRLHGDIRGPGRELLPSRFPVSGGQFDARSIPHDDGQRRPNSTIAWLELLSAALNR